MNRAKQLVASMFQLEQELMRGSWDEDVERKNLISFAENFEHNVKIAELNLNKKQKNKGEKLNKV